MKYLALAVLLAVMQASPPVPRKAADSAAGTRQHVKNQSSPKKTPAQPSSSTINADAAKRDETKSDGIRAENAEQPIRITELPSVSIRPAKRDWADRGYWVFSGLLVIIGGLQVWLLRGTLKATKDNAEAALLNAQAVINAERPWVLVNIKPKGANDQYMVGAFNAGRTPAIIIDGHFSCDKHSADFIPPEDLNAPFPRQKRDLIVSKDSFPIRVINPESLINQADREGGGTNPQTVFVYGQLRYWDTFTDRDSPAVKPYETWWCFHYDSTTKIFGRCDNGYTRNT